MARVNYEECWWSDPRRMKLALLLGSGALADGVAANAWRLAQEFWSDGSKLIPKELFDQLEHAPALVEARLADVRDSFVYVRGSSAYLSWLEEKREKAREAGQKSAQRARDEKGRLLPSEHPANVQRKSNESPTKANDVQPSGSGSGSFWFWFGREYPP